jgi:hypothetical protein
VGQIRETVGSLARSAASIAPRHLTDQHLKDLDVSRGQRLQVLQAIRELASTAPTHQAVGERGAMLAHGDVSRPCGFTRHQRAYAHRISNSFVAMLLARARRKKRYKLKLAHTDRRCTIGRIIDLDQTCAAAVRNTSLFASSGGKVST